MKYKKGDKVKYNGNRDKMLGAIFNVTEDQDSYLVSIHNDKFGSILCGEKYLIPEEDTNIPYFNNEIDVTDVCEILPIERDKTCSHQNKKKVDLIVSSYMYCPDCKQDLGSC